MDKSSPTTIYATGAANQQQRPANLRTLQLSSLTSGTLILISGGMNLAQSVGWSDARVSGSVGHFYYSWFIAVIIGTIICVPLAKILQKQLIMAVSSVLILAGGIMFASAPNSFEVLVAGRYLNGIAVGLITVPFLMHASEVSQCNKRGRSLAIEQYALTLGIGIQMVYTSQWPATSTFSTNCLHGILDIILAVLAAGSLFYFIESPVDYIRVGDDAAALDCLACMQRPPGVTMATNARLEDLKDYVREQESFSVAESLKRSIFPMLKMIFFRSMMLAFTYSVILTSTLQVTMIITQITWTPLLAGCLRIFGGSVTLLVVDKLGRKLPSLLWAAILAGLMIPMAFILGDSWNLLRPHKMSTVASMCVCLQFFAGLFAPNTSVYMGEAFPLRVKPYCMTLCVIIEQIIQIVVTCEAHSIGDYSTLMAMGFVILVAFVCFCATMPETKKTSLKECQARFANLFNFKMC